MKFLIVFLLISWGCLSQNKVVESQEPKGDHFLFYNKCFLAITFCEITQQTYTICGAVKNCYGLYVMPGDTFYLQVEDKNQTEDIFTDIYFDGYLPTINGFTFQPVDNNCYPSNAIQIVIPLTAVPGSSFQITAQNTSYVNSSLLSSGVPAPYNIYIGGQQPQYTFALSDFTICPIIEQVSVKELTSETNTSILYPNPSTGTVSLINHIPVDCILEVYDLLGNKIFRQTSIPNTVDITELSNGVYLCKLISNNKLIASEKLILIK